MLLEPPKCIYLQNQKVMWEPLTGWIKSYFKIYQALPDLLPGCFVVVPASFPPYKRAWPPPILGTGSVLLHPGSTGLSPPLLCLGLSSHLRSVTQLCPALLRHMDYSPPGSSVCGILQARILECVAISFSRGSSRESKPSLLCLLHWQADSLPLAPHVLFSWSLPWSLPTTQDSL